MEGHWRERRIVFRRPFGTRLWLPRRTLAFPNDRDIRLAKPNYSFEKRQREIAKKKQQDEKDARKREAREAAKAAAEPAPLKPASDGG